jgi:dipeptidyl aminopeptidase/acylaminoacyl peptidase
MDDRFVGLGTVPENLDAYLRHSPYMHIHHNEAPLLFLVCEGDQRCPPVQSELPFAILRSRGRPVEMVRYPAEPHYMAGVGRPDRRVDRIDRIVDWFSKHL